MMNVKQALQQNGIPCLDREVLLAYVLHNDRIWVIAHPEYELNPEQESQFKKILERRRAGEPVAYIMGEKEFYGRKFFVDPRVLIPRPSTEGLVEFVLENVKFKMKNEKLQIRKIDTGIVGIFIPLQPTNDNLPTIFVDIGTGSGCIAITLALELLNFSLPQRGRVRERGPSSPRGGEISNMRIIATDISADALDVARENARRHEVEGRIEFRQGNLLEPISDIDEAFMIVCNPPYVLEGIPLPPLPNPPPQPSPRLRPTSEGEGILHEPALALFAGPKGMDVLIPLITQARNHPYCQGIFLECQEEQVGYLPLRGRMKEGG